MMGIPVLPFIGMLVAIFAVQKLVPDDIEGANTVLPLPDSTGKKKPRRKKK